MRIATLLLTLCTCAGFAHAASPAPTGPQAERYQAAVREAGKTLEVVARQLGSVIDELGVGAFARAVVAYEPVWAIGTGLTASPAQAQEVHAAIRAQLAAENAEVAKGVRLLYGGSVKAASAAELFGMPDIDGGLVGGASLNADEFGAICRAAGS